MQPMRINPEQAIAAYTLAKTGANVLAIFSLEPPFTSAMTRDELDAAIDGLPNIQNEDKIALKTLTAVTPGLANAANAGQALRTNLALPGLANVLIAQLPATMKAATALAAYLANKTGANVLAIFSLEPPFTSAMTRDELDAAIDGLPNIQNEDKIALKTLTALTPVDAEQADAGLALRTNLALPGLANVLIAQLPAEIKVAAIKWLKEIPVGSITAEGLDVAKRYVSEAMFPDNMKKVDLIAAIKAMSPGEDQEAIKRRKLLLGLARALTKDTDAGRQLRAALPSKEGEKLDEEHVKAATTKWFMSMPVGNREELKKYLVATFPAAMTDTELKAAIETMQTGDGGEQNKALLLKMVAGIALGDNAVTNLINPEALNRLVVMMGTTSAMLPDAVYDANKQKLEAAITVIKGHQYANTENVAASRAADKQVINVGGVRPAPVDGQRLTYDEAIRQYNDAATVMGIPQSDPLTLDMVKLDMYCQTQKEAFWANLRADTPEGEKLRGTKKIEDIMKDRRGWRPLAGVPAVVIDGKTVVNAHMDVNKKPYFTASMSRTHVANPDFNRAMEGIMGNKPVAIRGIKNDKPMPDVAVAALLHGNRLIDTMPEPHELLLSRFMIPTVWSPGGPRGAETRWADLVESIETMTPRGKGAQGVGNWKNEFVVGDRTVKITQDSVIDIHDGEKDEVKVALYKGLILDVLGFRKRAVDKPQEANDFVNMLVDAQRQDANPGLGIRALIGEINTDPDYKDIKEAMNDRLRAENLAGLAAGEFLVIARE